MYSLRKGCIQRQKYILHYDTQHGVSNSVSYLFLPWKTPQLKQVTIMFVQVGDSKMAGRNSSRRLQPEAERPPRLPVIFQSQGEGPSQPQWWNSSSKAASPESCNTCSNSIPSWGPSVQIHALWGHPYLSNPAEQARVKIFYLTQQLHYKCWKW